MKKKLQFVVIGLGRFGESIARTLIEQKAEVLVVDQDEEKVNQAISYATHAIQMDATDEQALKSLGIRNFDVACVCMGDIQNSVLISLLCKEQGVPYVLAKVRSEIHSKLLDKVGVDRAVFPEREMGIRVAHNLLSPGILDFIELSPDYGIAELDVPELWANKSIVETDFRKRYGLNIVAIRHDDNDINVNPEPKDIILPGDTLIVIGSEEQIAKVDDVTSRHK
ncbi:MAG: potassium channel family protein [Christensenellaceae bacterium]|jgi:trk system potassium uptake protein TrkA